MGFDSSLKRPAFLATLKSCDTTKQSFWGWEYIYGYHHHHVALVAQISLALSRHSSLSFIALGRSSGQHPVSSHSCWMYVRAGRPAFPRPCVGAHKSTSLMSSFLLLQQCSYNLKWMNVYSWVCRILNSILCTNKIIWWDLFFFFIQKGGHHALTKRDWSSKWMIIIWSFWLRNKQLIWTFFKSIILLYSGSYLLKYASNITSSSGL